MISFGNLRVPTPQQPFKLSENATLHFVKVGTATIYDEDTGNYEPSIEAVDVPAYLKSDPRETRAIDSLGIDQNDRFLKGYVLGNSTTLATLDFSQSVRLTISDPVTGGTVTGQFDFEVVVSPASAAIAQVAGIPIKGILRLAGSGEVAAA